MTVSSYSSTPYTLISDRVILFVAFALSILSFFLPWFKIHYTAKYSDGNSEEETTYFSLVDKEMVKIAERADAKDFYYGMLSLVILTVISISVSFFASMFQYRDFLLFKISLFFSFLLPVIAVIVWNTSDTTKADSIQYTTSNKTLYTIEVSFKDVSGHMVLILSSSLCFIAFVLGFFIKVRV